MLVSATRSLPFVVEVRCLCPAKPKLMEREDGVPVIRGRPRHEYRVYPTYVQIRCSRCEQETQHPY